MRSWDEVLNSPAFQQLPKPDQDAAKAQYFDQAVAPRVAPDDIEAARAQFTAYRPDHKPSVSTLQRAGGLAVSGVEGLVQLGKDATINTADAAGRVARVAASPELSVSRRALSSIADAAASEFVGVDPEAQAAAEREIAQSPDIKIPNPIGKAYAATGLQAPMPLKDQDWYAQSGIEGNIRQSMDWLDSLKPDAVRADALHAAQQANAADGQGLIPEIKAAGRSMLDHPGNTLDQVAQSAASFILPGKAAAGAEEIARRAAIESSRVRMAKIAERMGINPGLSARLVDNAGRRAATLTAAAFAAEQSAESSVDQAAQAIDDTSDIDLITHSPRVRDAVAKAGSPEAQKQVLANVREQMKAEARQHAFEIAASVTGLSSLVSGAAEFEAKLFRAGTAPHAAKAIAKEIGEGVAKEGAQEFVESSGEQLASNVGERDSGANPGKDIWQGVGSQGTLGAVAGAIMGGSAAGTHATAGALRDRLERKGGEGNPPPPEPAATPSAPSAPSEDDINVAPASPDVFDEPAAPQKPKAKRQKTANDGFQAGLDDRGDGSDLSWDEAKKQLSTRTDADGNTLYVTPAGTVLGNEEKASKLWAIVSPKARAGYLAKPSFPARKEKSDGGVADDGRPSGSLDVGGSLGDPAGAGRAAGGSDRPGTPEPPVSAGRAPVAVDRGAGEQAARVAAQAEQEAAETPAEQAGEIEGPNEEAESRVFPAESGTLAIPREDMPQIRAEAHGALTNFLRARGVTHAIVNINPSMLKPTQDRYVPAKVEAAKQSTTERSVIVSSDGHIIDGHHQAIAKMQQGEPVKVIVLDKPLTDVLPLVHEFPSSSTAAAAESAAAPAASAADPNSPVERARAVYQRLKGERAIPEGSTVDPKLYDEQTDQQIANPARFHPVVEEDNPKGLKIGDAVTVKGSKPGYVTTIKSYAGKQQVRVASPVNYGGFYDIADVEKVPPAGRRAQPGEPGYTVDDARADLADLRTQLRNQGQVSDARLVDQVRQQERIVQDMERAAAPRREYPGRAGFQSDAAYEGAQSVVDYQNGDIDKADLIQRLGALKLLPAEVEAITYKLGDDWQAADTRAVEAAQKSVAAPDTNAESKPKSPAAAEPKASEKPATLADQLAGLSDADLEAMIDDVAHETSAAETEKPKAQRSASTKPRKPKGPDPDVLRAAYFAPGNIVKAYKGYDRVLEYTPPDSEHRWSVRVQSVVKQGDEWVNAPNEGPRRHATNPDARELQDGPVQSAEKWPPAMPEPKPRLRAGRTPLEAVPDASPRSIDQIASSLSVNLTGAGKEALTGLVKLFGTSGGKMNSGLTFDEETYAKAKPHFEQMLRDFQAAGRDLRDLIAELVRLLGTGAKPYIIRFARDLREARSDEQGTVRVEDSAQPDRVASEADAAAAAGRDIRVDGPDAREGRAEPAAGADESGLSVSRGRGSRESRDRESPARAGRRDDAGREGRTGEAGTGVSGELVTPVATNIPAADFEISDDLRLGRGGEVAKFEDNIAAIEALKRIEAENRRATPDEQRLLARYVGWGGLANAFPDPSTGEWKDKWKERGPRLRDLLTKAEYTAARRSTRNAHYTSEPVVRGMWRAAQRLGFRGGLALESSMGVGNFLGLKPADLPAKFIGIEYDSLTSRIAGALYPQATVLHSGFQSVPLPESTFALSIGNPPFGSESLRFQYKPELNGLSIHNQFFIGALDAVRPGGLHIAVVSRYLLDAQDTASRLMLAERGELVAAIRLPDTAFKENARTEVVTDIIILRRRDAADQESMKFAIQAYRQGKEKNADAERQRQALADKVPAWVTTVEIPDPLGGEAMRVNRYFQANPQHVIGVLERSDSMKQGADITVRLDDAGSLEQRLNEIVDRLPEGVSNIGQDVLDSTEQRYDLLSKALRIAVSGEEIGHVKLENDGSLSRVIEREGPDGSLLMTKQTLTPDSPFSDQLALDENGHWYRNELVTDDKGNPVKMPGKDGKPGKRNLYERKVYDRDSEVPLTLRLGKVGFAKLRGLANMRDLLKRQLVLETEDASAADMEANRQKLAKAYQDFVSEHGPINRAQTLALAMSMPDGGLISALEVAYQPARTKAQAERSGLPEQAEEAKPAPILRERVVPKYEPPTSAASAADALAIVLAERGSVDIERIAQLRGVSPEAAIVELQRGDKPLVFQDPETKTWETRDAYLSGQVRRKLEAAKAADLPLNVSALEAVQPAPWTAEEVSVKIGATWVPSTVYAQFVDHLLGGQAVVNFSALTNSFNVEARGGSEAKHAEWGTTRASAEYIIGRILNSLPTTVYDTDKDGNQTLNKEETQLAQLKAREISNAFEEWIFADRDRRKQLVDLFNDKFNTRVSRQFDGSHLTLPGKVPDAIISMRRHQKNAIWRGISTKELLLDHVVGAGKTFTGIARVMERRRMGISRKPAIVVPNHLVEQWASDVYRLYPAAKVLAAGKKDFEAKNRRKLFGKIATGDWDVVIIPHSSFGFIGIAPETELRFLEGEMVQAQAAIEEAWEVARENGQDQGRRKPFNVKEAERLAEKIQSRMDRLREGVRDKLLTYDQLGIDDLTVDEAHEFKNLFYSSRLTGVRGMGNKTGSRKAADLYNKVRVTRETGGAITFMTGTPVSNSAVELYTMMRYLASDALEELGLTHFDAWRAQYVDASPAFEPTETGRLKQVTRMGRSWENMRSLIDLYYSFADAVSIDDIKKAFAEDNPGREFPVPKVAGGGRRLIKIAPTPAQAAALDDIIQGFDGLDNITDPYERNAARLRLMDRARKVSLDVRAVDPRNPSTEPGGKLASVAQEVKRIYDAATPRRGTQLIFLDRSVPKAKGDDAILKKYDDLIAKQEQALRDGNEAALQEANEELEKFDSNEIAELRAAQGGGWTAYQQIKDNLIALGIPANEIRFVQEANTDEQKDALFEAVRGGKVRVLLGSTPRMGAGTNVQDRLVGLHHVDVTWKPSDIEQREGRIIRQGNRFADPASPEYDPLFEVEILAYATERTVDSKMWSLNATKLKTINALRKYDGAFTMQIDDEESVSMAEMAALASGNPLLLERVQLESEINDIELQQRAFRRKLRARDDAIDSARRIIQEYPARIAQMKDQASDAKARVDAVLKRAAKRTVDVEGKRFEHLMDAQKAVLEAITEQQAGDERARYAVSVDGKRYTNKQDIADAIGEAMGDADVFELTVGEKVYTQRTAAARAIRERMVSSLAGLSEGEEKAIPLGKAFGYDLIGDLSRSRHGISMDFALVDGSKTILSVRGALADPTNSESLSVQSLRPKVGNIFTEFAARASGDSSGYYQSALDRAKRELPELEAQGVPTFPKAEELAQKIARLGEVVKALGATAEPGEQPSFRRGAAVRGSVQDAERMIHKATMFWKNKPPIIVVSSMQDPRVPEAVRDADVKAKRNGAVGEPLGFIYQGKVYLNIAEANTPELLLRTLLHESLGHYGLRGVFGAGLQDELKKVALLRWPDVKAKIAQYGLEDTAKNRLRAAEEVLAELAETDPKLPLVQRVLAAIRSFLRPIYKAMGLTLELSDAELIRDYLIPAREWVQRGEGSAVESGAVPVFNRTSDDASRPDVRDLGFVLPNGARYARVTRDETGERYAYFDTREAAEQAGPGRAQDRANAAVQGAEQVRAEGSRPARQASGLVLKALARRASEALGSLEAVQRAAADGRLAVVPERRNQCFARSAAAALDGLGSMVIGRINGPDFRREWHAVVRLDDGAIYDPLDRHFYEPGIYERAYEFAPVRVLKPEVVQAFVARHDGAAPDPKSLGFEDIDSVDFSRSQAQTETSEFKRWFGDSKVVDENGKPLLVYHGSPVRGFDTFDLSKVNAYDPDGPYNGFFFSSSREHAEGAGRFPYGRPDATDSETRAFYLSLKNPATREQARKVARELRDDWAAQYPSARSLQDATRMELQARGYDGVVHSPYVSPSKAAFDRDGRVPLGKSGYTLVNEDGGVSLYDGNDEFITGYTDWNDALNQLKDGTFVAFNPASIKSATDNNGDFNPVDPRIAFSRSSPEDVRKRKREDYANVDISADGTTKMLERGRPAEQRVRARLGAIIDNAVRDQPKARVYMDAMSGKLRRGLGREAGLLSLMTMRQIKESYAGAFPNGSLGRYVDLNISRANEENRRARDTANITDQWQRLKDANALSELIHAATLAGVRPNADAADRASLRAEAKALQKRLDGMRAGMDGRDDGGTERQQAAVRRLESQIRRFAGLYANADLNHEKLRKQYLALSPEAQSVYDQAEQALIDQMEEEREAQIARVERMSAFNPESGEYEPADLQVRRDIIKRLNRAYEEAQGPAPYFPLKRFGQFVVRLQPHKDFDPGMEPVEFYESEIDAGLRLQQLRQQGYDAYQTTRSQFFEQDFNSAAPEFIREALQSIRASNLSESDKAAITDQFQQLWLKSLPDASALKTRIHRQGVPGFYKDAARSFAFTMLHGGNRIASLNHMDRMEHAIEEMKLQMKKLEQAAPARDNTLRQQLIDEIQTHMRDTIAPKYDPAAFFVQQLGFLWMLGGNVSTAAINLTQTLQFTIPGLLSQFPDTVNTLKVFGEISKGVANPKRVRLDIQGRKIDVDVPAGLTEVERKAYAELAERGTISITQAHDLAGVAQKGIDDSIMNPLRKKWLYWLSLPMHSSERINREIAAMAFYRLARLAGKSHEDAVSGADGFANETQFDYSAANRARIMRGPWVRVLALFKNYASHVIYRQWRDIRTALGVNAATADERAIATRAFLLRTAMVGMTTGLTGIMGVSTLLGMLSSLKDLFDDDDKPADLEYELAKALREALPAFGLGDVIANGAMPRNIAERSNMAGLLIRDDTRDSANPVDAWNRVLAAFAGPVGSIGANLLKGINDIGDGDVLRGLAEASPNVLAAPLKAARYANEGMLDRSGSPILENLTPSEIAMQALGFSPSRGIEHWEEVNRQKNIEQSLQQAAAKIRNGLAQAQLAGDQAGAAKWLDDLKAYNLRHPKAPIRSEDVQNTMRDLQRRRAQHERGQFIGNKAYREYQADDAEQ